MALFFYCLFSITKVKHSDEKEVGKYREANDYLPPDRSVFTFCVLSSEAPSAAVPLCVCVCVIVLNVFLIIRYTFSFLA